VAVKVKALLAFTALTALLAPLAGFGHFDGN
jgi:hypothetical protein